MNIESSQKLEQNKVSIVYAGTPILSKKILEKLNENFEIKAVLTQPDKIRAEQKSLLLLQLLNLQSRTTLNV